MIKRNAEHKNGGSFGFPDLANQIVEQCEPDGKHTKCPQAPFSFPKCSNFGEENIWEVKDQPV